DSLEPQLGERVENQVVGRGIVRALFGIERVAADFIPQHVEVPIEDRLPIDLRLGATKASLRGLERARRRLHRTLRYTAELPDLLANLRESGEALPRSRPMWFSHGANGELAPSIKQTREASVLLGKSHATTSQSQCSLW